MASVTVNGMGTASRFLLESFGSMHSVTSQISICGPVAEVEDLITTTRTLVFQPEVFRGDADLPSLMAIVKQQSNGALRRLKASVESLLAASAVNPIYVT